MDQKGHAVFHKAAHLIQRADGIAAGGQGVIDRVRQILQRIEQRAVQIEDRGVIGHKRFPISIGFPYHTTDGHRDASLWGKKPDQKET